MMESNTKKELLPRLCQLSGCPYLSDLHNSYYSKNVLGALRAIPASSYSLEQWRDAYRYIARDDATGKTREETAWELIRYLESKTK